MEAFAHHVALTLKGQTDVALVGPRDTGQTTLTYQLVFVFDEFQRLRACPGDPLAVIRSALMSSGANHVSLLFTGSIRNALRLMLEESGAPLFGEAAEMQLPVIARADFLEYLDYH